MVRIINRAQGLSGLNPLAYMGVQGASSNNTVVPLVVFNVDPNVNDFQNFSLLTVWLNSTNENVWVLVSLEENQATWVLLASGGHGSVISILTDNGIANPTSGVIDLFATPNAGHSVSFSAVGNTINLNTTDTSLNTFIGQLSGAMIAGGIENTSLGFSSLNALTSGNHNTALGYQSTSDLTTGSFNTCIGDLSCSALVTGSSNTIIGQGAGVHYTTSESNNIIIGQGVLGTALESNSTRIGDPASVTNCVVGGIYGQTVGATQGFVIIDNTGKLGSVSESTFANSFTTDSGTAVPVSGALNILASPPACGQTVSFSGTGNTVTLNMSSGNNTFIGAGSGAGGLAASNTALGVGTLASGPSNFNVAIGYQALNVQTGSGAENVAVGYQAMSSFVTSSNGSHTAIGGSALSSLTGGNYNTALGNSSLENLLTGITNTCIGNASGINYTGSESGNILIGNDTRGVASESNTLRIGTITSTPIVAAYIDGIFGASYNAGTGVSVFVDSNNKLGTVSSSIRFKENVKDMSLSSSDIYNLRPVVFNYKNDDSATLCFGLIAEEVKEIMPEIVVHDENNEVMTVKYHDLIPMLLNEIQKLNKRIEQLEYK